MLYEMGPKAGKDIWNIPWDIAVYEDFPFNIHLQR